MELLAPAGDAECLVAALDAGADAVYLGLRNLNARRRARNFDPEELRQAVLVAHARGRRVYLTLNTDISQRELGEAARALELARQCGVDAVLVRDPALLALRHIYGLEFHFSTQTCMTSSADVAAAAQLGASRVVLARELTLEEIRAAAAAAPIGVEVFAQGALCFCVSGRCLLSSWVGGRSGNRGMCTSPCRVPWTIGGRDAGTRLSMRDLCVVGRLGDLRRAGVAAIKIEGRLKNAAWVARAVSLYRKALDGSADPAALEDEARSLGDYTGRQMTCAYLDGGRDGLTGLALGRAPASAAGTSVAAADEPQDAGYDLRITITDRAIECCCECAGRSVRWTMPRTRVKRQYKAVAVRDLFQRLGEVDGQPPRRLSASDEEYLLVPRAANAIEQRVCASVRQMLRRDDRPLGVELSAEVYRAIAAQPPHPDNRLTPGSPPDRARLEASQAAEFVRHIAHMRIAPRGIIVEQPDGETLDRLRRLCGHIELVAALPAVFFEDEIASLRGLLDECRRNDIVVEVNSFGGWYLAERAGVRMEAGPGLGVLNALAARKLAEMGAACVTLSVEADRRQLEEITAACPCLCSVVVFGRPALLVTRARLSEQWLGGVFEDRRGTRIVPRLERGLWTFRPVEPFDLRNCPNERIRAAHLVVDLVGSPSPAEEWQRLPGRCAKTFRFNYERRLA